MTTQQTVDSAANHQGQNVHCPTPTPRNLEQTEKLTGGEKRQKRLYLRYIDKLTNSYFMTRASGAPPLSNMSKMSNTTKVDTNGNGN